MEVVNLGELPVSNFVDNPEELEKYPVVLSLCKKSGLVQLKHTINPDILYSQYWYFSGINRSMKDHLCEIVNYAIDSVDDLDNGDVVLDIACNDGTLLAFYPNRVKTVGIDPAKNIQAPEWMHTRIYDYFNAGAYQAQALKRAKIITSIAVFYDLENPIQFVQDIEKLLDENGVWVLEMSYLPIMLEKNSFDTICAEHLEYYSLAAFEYLLRNNTGLAVEDVSVNSMNGGSFRLLVKHASKCNPKKSVYDMRESEKALNLDNPQTYVDFMKRVEYNKHELITFLKLVKEQGKVVMGYGASTKGNTLLSYFGITQELLPYIADRNPIKHGKKAVNGSMIISEEQARALLPDYFLVLPYHFIEEFKGREKEFLDRGGKFVIPCPAFEIL